MKPRVEFDLSILKNNIVKLKNKTNNINFLFPVKCCNNPKVLEMIVANNFGFDISNIARTGSQTLKHIFNMHRV